MHASPVKLAPRRGKSLGWQVESPEAEKI